MAKGQSYKSKALALFKSRLGKIVKSSELASVTGRKGGPISHNIRRIFELRDEDGYDIANWKDNGRTRLNLKVDEWVLLNPEPNPSNIRTRQYTKKTWLQVMERDNYQCQICGRTKEDDDPFKPGHKVTLHLGHKHAFKALEGEWGESDNPNNYMVLCNVCNEGMKNKDIKVITLLDRVKGANEKEKEEIFKYLKELFRE
mgnify:CR=1 FL=1